MATGESKSKWSGNGSSLHQGSTQTGEDAFDLYLAYSGKLSVESILSTPQADVQVVWQSHQHAKDDNRLYYGDSLPVLALAGCDPSISGQVKLVYIDPPFSTNSVFKSRTQRDAYQDVLVGWRYIEFIRARLVWIRELMARDGSIYVHIDGNMAFHLKIIMDEIFGRTNFRNFITRRKCNPKNYTRKKYGNISDYILFYTKSDDYIWNRAIDQWTDAHSEREYPYIEEDTGRRFKKVPVHAPGMRNGETGATWRGQKPPPGKHWQYTPRVLDEMDARGEIFWSANGNPRRKVYLDNSQGVPVQDIWWEMRDAHNQNIRITGYPTEKNPDLLRRIISASSNPGDLVLDCFSGSGTTLAVAGELGRRWVGIDNSPEAIATTLKRFAGGSEPMGDFVQKPSKQPSQQLSLDITVQPEALVRNFTLYAERSHAQDVSVSVDWWKSLNTT